MPLTPGTRLGSYEVVTLLGTGGMGEVYRARDPKLNRDVALKVLPDSFASDADRLARFTREAHTLAALNHPNIAQIHGFEESGGVRALVMELVEGDDLSQRIARGAIPLDEALPIARQIAEALEAAHEKGIVHRDLKPANIKVRADGTVKVLDFGLAKAMEPAATNMSMSPTITTPAMTQAGTILGTAAYMSPEQAKGRPVDRRSDVWALGCVLFEMLTGTQCFPGDTVSDVIAAVLRAEPNWSVLPPIPPTTRTFLRRSLEKDPLRRVGSMAVARFLLDGSANGAEITEAPICLRRAAGSLRGCGPVFVRRLRPSSFRSSGVTVAPCSLPYHRSSRVSFRPMARRSTLRALRCQRSRRTDIQLCLARVQRTGGDSYGCAAWTDHRYKRCPAASWGTSLFGRPTVGSWASRLATDW